MSKSQNATSNSSLVSIWKPRSCSVLPDADKHEEDQTHVIDIEALRAIRRIVLVIEKRINSGDNFGNNPRPSPAGNPSSSKTPGPNSGHDNNQGEADDR